MEKANKNEFIEIKYTGYSNGEIFDSNIEEDLQKISKEKPKETIIVVGQRMVVQGLDNALNGKEIGKEYRIKLSSKEGFGERRRELIKIIPLKSFTDKNIKPYIGMMLTLDDLLVKILAISGARVTADFNNPLSSKDIEYKFVIVRKVTNEAEKIKFLFSIFFGFVPEFEVKEAVIVKGQPELEEMVKTFGSKFKELIGKDLVYEFKENKSLKEPNKFEPAV